MNAEPTWRPIRRFFKLLQLDRKDITYIYVYALFAGLITLSIPLGVARVLAQEPEIILADEPVSNLDPGLTDDVLGLLTEASQRHNATLIMSLHQPLLAQRYADRVIGLRAGHVLYDESSERLNDAAIQTIYGREVNPGAKSASQQTLANSWRATSLFDQVAP